MCGIMMMTMMIGINGLVGGPVYWHCLYDGLIVYNMVMMIDMIPGFHVGQKIIYISHQSPKESTRIPATPMPLHALDITRTAQRHSNKDWEEIGNETNNNTINTA